MKKFQVELEVQQVTGGTVTLPADVLNGLDNAKAEKRKKQKVSVDFSAEFKLWKKLRKRQEDRPLKIITEDAQMIDIVRDMMIDVTETIEMSLDIITIPMFHKGALMFEIDENKFKSQKPFWEIFK